MITMRKSAIIFKYNINYEECQWKLLFLIYYDYKKSKKEELQILKILASRQKIPTYKNCALEVLFILADFYM